MKVYQDKSRSFLERATDLVSRMTLDEKIIQTFYTAPAIERLGIRAWQWSNECAHGILPIYDDFNATSFPSALAMGCTWNPELLEQVGNAVSDEARGIFSTGKFGLCCYSPNINIGRDARWGRNDDQYGEDPVLSGKCAAAYIRGLQGYNGKYYKIIATPKHFACNNTEFHRASQNSMIEEATLREYYLKVFEIAVKEGGAKSIMSAYNRINGVPAATNRWLLNDVLREEWGFRGFVVTDLDGMTHPGEGYYYNNLLESVAAGLHAGNDECNGDTNNRALKAAIEQGYADENELDRALIRMFACRFALGDFDEGDCPYEAISPDCVCSESHAALAQQTAEESIVLLKNEGNILPIDTKKYKKILVVGPTAVYRQLGGYSIGSTIAKHGNTLVYDPPLYGIQKLGTQFHTEIAYAKGWNIDLNAGEPPMIMMPNGTGDMPFFPKKKKLEPEFLENGDVNYHDNIADEPVLGILDREDTPQAKQFSRVITTLHQIEDPEPGTDAELMAHAVAAARDADLVIFVAGTDASVTGEDEDRETLHLPYQQGKRLRKIVAANPNTILVGATCGPFTDDVFDLVPAVVSAIYGGEAQGTALANVLFGVTCPSGKTNQTWYRNENQLPHISSYGIKPIDTTTELGRTYMYFKGDVRYPFGYGLSYTKFETENYHMDQSVYDANDHLKASVCITNTGSVTGAEVLQLYIRKRGKSEIKPKKQLKAWKKIFLQPGETSTVVFDIPVSELAFWNNYQRKYMVEAGRYDVMISTSSQDADICGRSIITVNGTWDVKPTVLTLESSRYIMSAKETAKLSATAVREDTSRISDVLMHCVFKSSDEKIADVNSNGLITAKSAGTVMITATLEIEGITLRDHIAITVKDTELSCI